MVFAKKLIFEDIDDKQKLFYIIVLVLILLIVSFFVTTQLYDRRIFPKKRIK